MIDTDESKQPLHVVMLFDTEINLGISSHPDRWVNYDNVFFTDPKEAFIYYLYTNAPSAQLISADDGYELKCLMGEMILNYMNDSWKNDMIYS